MASTAPFTYPTGLFVALLKLRICQQTGDPYSIQPINGYPRKTQAHSHTHTSRRVQSSDTKNLRIDAHLLRLGVKDLHPVIALVHDEEISTQGFGKKIKQKKYTSRDPKQLRTNGQAQTCQQLVAFCASTLMNQSDAVVHPARVA